MGLSRRAVLGLPLALLGCSRAGGPLPVLGEVPPFSFTDQDDRPFTAAELTGRPWAVAFFFTRCPTVCPRMLARMKELHERAKTRGAALGLLAISVDPEHDTPEVLRRHAEKHGVAGGVVRFVTGDPEAVRRVSVDGFKLALEGKIDPKADHFGLLHAAYLTLVDARGRLRGYYRTTDDTLDQLLSDLGRL